MKRIRTRLLCHLLVMAGSGLMTAPAQAQPHFAFQIGGVVDGQFLTPEGVAVDTNTGNIVVNDTDNYRIQVLDSQGHFLFKFGSFGTGDGQFPSTPRGVAVDTNTGHIVVADAGAFLIRIASIQVFDRQGNFLFKCRCFGSNFVQPNGVAVDAASGTIYVSDGVSNSIWIFDGQGNFLRRLGSGGTGDGQFFAPWGVAVDASSHLYVADYRNNRIQIFDGQGDFLRKFGSHGSGDGQFDGPSSVAVDASGNIVVGETGNDRIQVFDSQGNFLRKFGSHGSGDGQFKFLSGVAVDASGNIVLADTGNDRIQVFDSVGDFVLKFGDPRLFDYPDGVAVSSSGNIYVADPGHFSIQVFDSQGHFLFKFGQGQLGYDVVGVAVATSGNIVVLEESPDDLSGNRGTLQIFDSQGNFLKKVALPAQAEVSTQDYFQGVAVDASDHILVTHTFYDYFQNQSDVLILDSQGNFLGRFGGASLNFPEGVVVDQNTGNVVVANTGDNNIVIFDSQGGVIRRFGSSGSGDGQFDYPSGAAVDASGNIYVTEPAGYYPGNHRIQVFDSQGNFITKFSSFDTDRAVFSPRGIAVDASSGNIVVADPPNDGIRVFVP